MYCVKCGAENVTEAKFCFACGTKIEEQKYQPNEAREQQESGFKDAASMDEELQSGKVVIQRHASAIVDSWEAYCVYINDREVGKIKKGRREVFQVAPGEHIVQLKKDWMKSRPLQVNVPAGGMVNLFCEPNGKPLHYLFLMFFQPGNYIGLRLVHE